MRWPFKLPILRHLIILFRGCCVRKEVSKILQQIQRVLEVTVIFINFNSIYG